MIIAYKVANIRFITLFGIIIESISAYFSRARYNITCLKSNSTYCSYLLIAKATIEIGNKLRSSKQLNPFYIRRLFGGLSPSIVDFARFSSSFNETVELDILLATWSSGK